ncbi:hypothetical protein AGMMS49975_16700 [Clostridia bacterium]|nr:hypothetical protein AGMMS49975_16700 [Clostridia bacterium]
MINDIVFSPDGIGLRTIHNENDSFTEVISFDKARKISDALELYYAMEDVRSHLPDRYEQGGTDENGDYLYDRDKYTESAIRAISQEVVERKSDNSNIQETYFFLIDWVLDDYDEGKVII